MSEGFDLKELIFECGKSRASYGCPVIHVDNVEEFIRRIKDLIERTLPINLQMNYLCKKLKDGIDELSGGL